MNVRGITGLRLLYAAMCLLRFSVVTADDDSDSNSGPSNRQPVGQTVFRMDDGDEFNNPNGCSSACPTGSSTVLHNPCLCKCVPLWTWRQDLGKCQLESECSFSISTGSHVPTMAFEEERNRFLKPDHVVQKNGKSVSASDNYYIRSFRLLQYGRTTWTPPKLTLWLDFFFSTKNVEFEAITSAARNQDLDEYYGSLVNFTIGQGLANQGCLMVKFTSNITNKSRHAVPSPSHDVPPVTGLFGSNSPTVHHPTTTNIGKKGSQLVSSVYLTSTRGLMSEASERMTPHHGQGLHVKQTSLLLKSVDTTPLFMSSSFVDRLRSDGQLDPGGHLHNSLNLVIGHVTSIETSLSSTHLPTSIPDDGIDDEGLESTTLIVTILTGGTVVIFSAILVVSVAVRRVVLAKKKGIRRNRDARGGHVSTNSIQCIAFPQSSQAPPRGQNISAPWYSTLTAIHKQSRAATTTTTPAAVAAQVVTNVTADSTATRDEELYEDYLHPYERPIDFPEDSRRWYEPLRIEDDQQGSHNYQPPEKQL